jgi:hypothetical protein
MYASHAVIGVGYYPWQSPHIAQQPCAEGVPMHEFRATTQSQILSHFR